MSTIATANPYPARLEVDYPDHLDRLTTGLRFLWIVPIGIVLLFVSGAGGTYVVRETGETIRHSGGSILMGLGMATALMIV
ncbi:MAG: hypothetical protein AB7I13_21575, partial [Vicinamibacterales bacterium]